MGLAGGFLQLSGCGFRILEMAYRFLHKEINQFFKRSSRNLFWRKNSSVKNSEVAPKVPLKTAPWASVLNLRNKLVMKWFFSLEIISIK